MNDFLRNLRTTHKKEAPPQRNPLDSHFHPPTEHRLIREKRLSKPSHQKAKSSVEFKKKWEEMLPIIIENTCAMAKHIEKMAAINEMEMESKIRMNNTVANFFETLTEMVQHIEPSELSYPPPMATSSYACGTHYTKDEILNIIMDMRDQGGTFAMIAEYLREKGIPTFSGKGEWHAQTIHRLCKEE
ncbi:MAG: hypothetical protein CSA29_03385 [Desulfobacterales bacterium]|nr:MAG: hypothetical protein CSA29_03385 [Desulfobacterales bacterium]